MATGNRCEHALLARGAVSEVLYCRQCRVFHLNVDAVTVHLASGALRDLRDTLTAAIAAHARLSPHESTEAAAPRQSVKLAH